LKVMLYLVGSYWCKYFNYFYVIHLLQKLMSVPQEPMGVRMVQLV